MQFWYRDSMNELGFIHVYTGAGKGKTTAAFGLALRAWGCGGKVCIIQFLKKGDKYGEALAIERLEGIDLYQYGSGQFLFNKKPRPADVEAAERGLAHARQVLSSGDYSLVILDEMNIATDFGVLDVNDVIEVIDSRAENVEVVLTGQNAHPAMVEKADYVTEMKKIKHPYDRGVKARRGVEF